MGLDGGEGEHANPRSRIYDEDALYRRLPPSTVTDGRVGSNAFKDKRGKPDGAISVEIARLTTPERVLGEYRERGWGLGVFPASVPRGIGLTVEHRPSKRSKAHEAKQGTR